MNGYRKELKFIVGDDTLIDVRNRIKGLMRPDDHQRGDHYRIRSIYFDSPAYTCYRENAAGVSPREKYRIRTYDCSEDVIVAEIKIRHRDTISKMGTRITKDLFDRLISNDPGEISSVLPAMIRTEELSSDSSGRRVLEKYAARMLTEAYRPACIVDYERSAFVYDIANVRITLDRNVFASREYGRMFDKSLTGRAALDTNQHILEIKYDEFLPDEISSVLGGMGLTRSSSSKYAKCLIRCCPEGDI